MKFECGSNPVFNMKFVTIKFFNYSENAEISFWNGMKDDDGFFITMEIPKEEVLSCLYYNNNGELMWTRGYNTTVLGMTVPADIYNNISKFASENTDFAQWFSGRKSGDIDCNEKTVEHKLIVKSKPFPGFDFYILRKV